MPGPCPILVVVGPTAVGKTAVAIELALRLGGEVISADSMQVYRGMSIATDNPSPEERRGVPHHLIGVVDPTETFTVARYQQMADAVIAQVCGRGKLPILAGGTGLYVRAVVDGLLFPDSSADPVLRRRLEEEARRWGPVHLHQRLRQVDPEAAGRLHPNDLRRVIRALEVFESTGVPISEHQRRSRQLPGPRYRAVFVGLTRDRQRLYRRIEERVDRQLARGLVEEVRRVLASAGKQTTAAQALGYKEIAAYLRGECTLEEAVRILKRNTRRYAKRQWSWFRADPRIRWFDLDTFAGEAEAAAAIADYAEPLLRQASSPATGRIDG